MSTRQPISTFLGIAAAVVLVSSSYAADINVPGDQATIQAGIGAANPGDVVIVAQGEYFENIDFLGKAITVRSTDPNDAGVVLHTIINGGGSGVVVRCFHGEDSDTVLSGFVITGGDTGMQISLSSCPTVTNCTFSGNSSKVNGGAMVIAVGSNPTVTRCAFIGNSANNNGGAIHTHNTNPTFTDCTFIGNTAAINGGAIYNLNSHPTITNCTFSGNTAGFNGGGMDNAGTSSPTVTNSGFCDNTPGQINGTFTDGGGNSLLYCPPPIPACPTDINGDGVTNVLDLIQLLLAFGAACP